MKFFLKNSNFRSQTMGHLGKGELQPLLGPPTGTKVALSLGVLNANMYEKIFVLTYIWDLSTNSFYYTSKFCRT